VPPTYRHRLRLEGAWLAACGAAGSAALLATTEEARRWPLNTAGQLALTAAIAIPVGRAIARRAVAAAADREPAEIGSGQPTPLWMHPLIVAGLTSLVVVPRELGVEAAGWDAGLRVTAGCAIVGLTQAIAIERAVAAAERANGRTYYRVKGSQGPRTVLAGVRASERT
jgi:hypothetical protein